MVSTLCTGTDLDMKNETKLDLLRPHTMAWRRESLMRRLATKHTCSDIQSCPGCLKAGLFNNKLRWARFYMGRTFSAAFAEIDFFFGGELMNKL